ncbi:MAG: OmpH family outer membrane protein [Pseudomonadales bacterium]
MVKNILSGSLLCLALVAGSAVAQLKVAVLDTQRALLESEEARQLLQTAQSELEKEQNEVNELGMEIMALQEQLQKDAEVMSPTELRRRQKTIEDKQIDYQFQVNRLQKEVQDRRQELMQVMAPKIDAVLQDLIEVEGYDLILQRGNLLYANSRHDITRKVTEKLNERRGSGGR